MSTRTDPFQQAAQILGGAAGQAAQTFAQAAAPTVEQLGGAAGQGFQGAVQPALQPMLQQAGATAGTSAGQAAADAFTPLLLGVGVLSLIAISAVAVLASRQRSQPDPYGRALRP